MARAVSHLAWGGAGVARACPVPPVADHRLCGGRLRAAAQLQPCDFALSKMLRAGGQKLAPPTLGGRMKELQSRRCCQEAGGEGGRGSMREAAPPPQQEQVRANAPRYVLLCSVMFCPVLSCPVLSSPVMSCPALLCSVLPYHNQPNQHQIAPQQHTAATRYGASGTQGMPCGHPGPARPGWPPGPDRHTGGGGAPSGPRSGRPGIFGHIPYPV
eukprot:gene19477-biopygen20533